MINTEYTSEKPVDHRNTHPQHGKGPHTRSLCTGCLPGTPSPPPSPTGFSAGWGTGHLIDTEYTSEKPTEPRNTHPRHCCGSQAPPPAFMAFTVPLPSPLPLSGRHARGVNGLEQACFNIRHHRTTAFDVRNQQKGPARTRNIAFGDRAVHAKSAVSAHCLGCGRPEDRPQSAQ